MAALAEVPDPRARRGIRHRLVTVLAVAVCAVLAGARSYVAIAEWAHDLPLGVRVRLGITVDGRAERVGDPPDPAGRRPGRAGPGGVGVAGRPAARTARQPGPGAAQRAGESAGSGGAGRGPPARSAARVIAVDGKTARGARGADGRAVHLLAAFEPCSGIVLGQIRGRRQVQRADRPLCGAREGGKLHRGRSGRRRVILVRVSP